MSAKNLEMSCESPPPQLPDPWPKANDPDDDQLPEPEPIDLLSPLPVMHELAALPLYFPALHVEHCVAAIPLYLPAPHGMQSFEEFFPMSG